MADDIFAPQPFDVDRLYPAGLPDIHAVPATYRAGLAHFAEHVSNAAQQLQALLAARPDADAELDAEAARLGDAWFALQRTLVHYRAYRDVQGWG